MSNLLTETYVGAAPVSSELRIQRGEEYRHGRIERYGAHLPDRKAGKRRRWTRTLWAGGALREADAGACEAGSNDGQRPHDDRRRE